MRSDVIETLDRLENIDKPCRYSDCHLWVIAKGGDARMRVCDTSEQEFVWERGVDGLWIRSVEKFKVVPKYTASLEAAFSFSTKIAPSRPVLVGWNQTAKTLPWARVGQWSGADATGANPAIALCIAVLRSKQEG